MKVLLVCPPWGKLFGGGTNDIPLGMGYLAAVLKKDGISADIYNADYNKAAYFEQSDFAKNLEKYLEIQGNLDHPIWQEVKKVVSFFNPDVVGINTTTPKFVSVINVAKICKEINPNVKIVIGGPHASCLPTDAAKNEYIDFVVRGEGEYTFLELVQMLRDGKDVKKCLGITFRSNGKTISNPDRPLIEKLDELPFPFRKFYIDEEEIRTPTYEGILFATRGCPSRCIFCASHKIWTRKVRYRSPENVVDEIEEVMAKYGLRYIRFDDDSFTLNKNFVTRICDLIIERKLNIDWYCSTRVDVVSKELLLKMKESGCMRINLGVEAGSEETLLKVKKGITKEQIKKAFALAKEVGIFAGAFIMIGFPWETKKHMRETLDFTTSLNPSVITISIVTPYPGTELYDLSQDLGLLSKDIQFENLLHQSPSIIPVKMTKEEFHRDANEIINMVEEYNRKQRINKLKDFGYMIKITKRFRKNPKLLLLVGKRLLKKRI